MISPRLVILLAMALVLVLLVVLAVVLYLMVNGPRARLHRRVLQVAGGAKGGEGMRSASDSGLARRRSVQAKLKELDATRQRRRGYKLREELAQAGLPLGVRQFLLASLAVALAVAALTSVFGLSPAIVLALTIIAGIGLPRMAVRILISRRIRKFTSHFAEALDTIVRGVRSGLPVGECFNMIAREMPDPVGTEFRLFVEGQRLGLTLDEVLQKGAERVPTAELRFFAIVLAIQQTTGGNLAETLSKLSEVLRNRKRMRDKIQAMSTEAKSSAAIIGSLPIIVGLLLSLIAPDYIAILFNSQGGHVILFAGLCIMATGIIVMRQMINFDI
jgi:tight adherence protein B